MFTHGECGVSCTHLPVRKLLTRLSGNSGWPARRRGKRASTYRLEFDHHPIPKARGGPATIENIRVACEPHNKLAARRFFGDAVMDRYARRPSTPG